ncbi:MAG TPA: serine hydrolase [Chitinophagaceae bacterium]|nr:serine hydrolase [Chitinophagaceae bacterium]
MRYTTIILLIATCLTVRSQEKTDAWLDQLLRQHASPLLLKVLNNPDSFQYQLIYTQIDRDKNNRPGFKHYYLHVDRNRYFNPASTVKMPLAFLALEKINELNIKGLNKGTPMLTDSSFDAQSKAWHDSSAANYLPSIAHYIKKIFLVSDNDAYNRLYEFIGQETINNKLWQKGYTDTRITRRFVTMTEEQNRYTNRIRFVKDGQTIYNQPPAYSNAKFNFSRKLLVGHSHYNRNEELVNAPMDFTTHNNYPLEDQQQVLQSVIFPASVRANQRFKLTEDDYKFLYHYMSAYPSESKFPAYDTARYFNSYTKFFMFRAGKTVPPPNIRVFNKTGWSYGFLTDAAYIIDLENNIEFMLTGTIYVNRDGVLNDNKYEYEETGYPFFKEVGNIIYQHELKRPRKYKPNLSRFTIDYSKQ